MNTRFSKVRGAAMAALMSLPLPLTIYAQGQPATTQPPSGQAPQQGRNIYRFSLKEAIDYGSKNSVKVKNALLDYQIQEQSNRATTSQALPQITGTAGITDYLQIPITPVPGAFLSPPQSGFIPLKFQTQYTSSGSVTLKQVLFDGQVFVGLQARQASLDYYRKSQEVTEQSLRANIYKVYYQLLLSRIQTELIDANIAKVRELLNNTTQMFKNGFAEQLDIDKASVQLTNFESQKLQVNYNIDNGYLGLKVLMGMPIRDSLVLTDTLTDDMIRDAAMNDAFQYTDRRDYQLLQINRHLNEYDIKRYKKEYIPTASFSANYSQNNYGNTLNLFQGNAWFPSTYIALNINIPIFDGFYKDANIQKSKYALRQTENNLEALKISIDNDVKQAQLKFNSSLATLDYEKKNMTLAESVYNQTRKKFEQGLGSNTEITSAQADLTQAQNNYLNALYNAVVAKVDYQNSIGKL